ncbi:MAG: type II toxin-antitoxin system VapC family toxin [Candidatus Micrarchaeota archaeon]
MLDSFAWFEYFSGSAAGRVVAGLLASGERLGTPATCVAEIKRKRKREGAPWEKELQFIASRSEVLPVTLKAAQLAGDVEQLHFADALVYAVALEHGAVLVTGDAHFKALPRVKLL